MVTNIRLAVAALSVIFVCVIAAQIAHPDYPRSAAAQQCGDVNDDDAVTATDALAVLKAAVGQSVELICATFVQLCWDLDADGFCAPVEDSNDDDICDALDCTIPDPCGNGTVDEDEDCDFGDLNGETCGTQGQFGEGLACSPGTCVFDTSGCSATRYEDTGLGTVIDHQTGLEWQKTDDDGGLTDKDNFYSWTAGSPEANGTAFGVFLEGLNGGVQEGAGPTTAGYAGHNDWRMPRIEELTTIVDCSFVNPCIDQSVFGATNTSTIYWSSSTILINPAYAWVLNFFVGGATGSVKDSFIGKVRAVRGGS